MNKKKLKKENLPEHVAVIPDGNRRWARRNNKPKIEGHRAAGEKIMDDLVFHALDLEIPYLTFWVFSTENWKRGEKFANALFKLLEKELFKGYEKYDQAGIRLNTIGNLSRIPDSLANKLRDWEDKSRKNKNLTVTIAINYGGRDEILRAINKVVRSKVKGRRSKAEGQKSGEVEKLTEEEFEKYLDTADLPDPDLIIRTGKEKRLSGFLLWQCNYSELYFSDVLMPDFGTAELDKALADYLERQRRFGK